MRSSDTNQGRGSDNLLGGSGIIRQTMSPFSSKGDGEVHNVRSIKVAKGIGGTVSITNFNKRTNSNQEGQVKGKKKTSGEAS